VFFNGIFVLQISFFQLYWPYLKVNHTKKMPVVTVKVKDSNGKVHDLILDADQNKSIIDLAEDKGIDLPYSCRSGACFSCCGEVKQ